MTRTLILVALAGLFGVALVPRALAQRGRPQPSARAAKCGTHLPWQSSLDAALRAAAEQKRCVLWYVPTVPRSPMDRVPVLDLYMRAGFFSEPELEPLLRCFVLYRGKPSMAEAQRFDLLPFRFVEPGFLVLDGEGKVCARAHQITTFSPQWLVSRLVPHAGKAFGEMKLLPLPEEGSPGDALRARFQRGAELWRAGKHAAAREHWLRLAKDAPEHPLGWRAAAEAEGFGPIARGFWIARPLPDGWQCDDPGTTAPRDASATALLRRCSVELLLEMQGEDGGFEDSNYDFGGQDSLPNVWVAVTALATSALLRQRAVAPERCDAAIARGVGYVTNPAKLAPEDHDEWVWARVYPIHLLCDLLAYDGTVEGFPRERLRALLASTVAELWTRQGRDGAFRHEYANPFVTAAVLVAAKEAERHGVVSPEREVARAAASLERCRNRRGAFSYSQVTGSRRTSASVQASAGRMPYCEAALHACGLSDDARLAAALDAAFEHHGELGSTRKYDDHANAHGYGGFFFWFDMLGREIAMRRLGEAAARWRGKQLELVLAIPEIDGGFVDSHELGRGYGTAMALLCLPRGE